MKDKFLVDLNIHFLNHGSFGACPRIVFEAYQKWQLKLENQPVKFITSRLNEELCRSRARLAVYLGVEAEDLNFIPNTTHGINQVLRSLPFSPGDEILTTNQEYGACENVLQYVSRKTGAVIVEQRVPLPAESKEIWIEKFWAGVTEKTKLIFLSHITSPTAQRFPVKEVCARAAQNGILSLIDGAHAPGQLDLNVSDIDADFYIGNCHKWMMAPKGSAFLYVRREKQHLIEPLVVGWGLSSIPSFETGIRFLDHNTWLGTDDLSSYIAVADAIDFYEMHDWVSVRAACSQVLSEALDKVNQLIGKSSLVAPGDEGALQMGIAELPLVKDLNLLKRRLLSEYNVEVPLIEWEGRHFVRISIQGYNTSADVACLVKALAALLPESRIG